VNRGRKKLRDWQRLSIMNPMISIIFYFITVLYHKVHNNSKVIIMKICSGLQIIYLCDRKKPLINKWVSTKEI
jgi:hypothetical protein